MFIILEKLKLSKMKNVLLFTVIAIICMAAGCGGGEEKPKSPSELKKQREDSVKTAAKDAVKDFFDLLKKKEHDKVKGKVEEASLPNLEVLLGEAEKYKEENKIQEPIEVEVLETILVAPDKVNCKTRCKIKDKEIIRIIPVIIVKDKGCRIALQPDHFPFYRFVVFSNHYDVIVINYDKKYKKYKKPKHYYEYEKKGKKKKKKHPKGHAYGHDDD
jgi:hypothetical protein